MQIKLIDITRSDAGLYKELGVSPEALKRIKAHLPPKKPDQKDTR